MSTFGYTLQGIHTEILWKNNTTYFYLLKKDEMDSEESI